MKNIQVVVATQPLQCGNYFILFLPFGILGHLAEPSRQSTAFDITTQLCVGFAQSLPKYPKSSRKFEGVSNVLVSTSRNAHQQKMQKSGLFLGRLHRLGAPLFSELPAAAVSCSTPTGELLCWRAQLPEGLKVWFTPYCQHNDHNPCKHGPNKYCLFSELRGNTVRDSEATGRELNVNSENSEIKLHYMSRL